MSRFVYNLRYIKSKKEKLNLVNYIATREGVEKFTHSPQAAHRPATAKQTDKIRELLELYPTATELLEYEDYISNPTMKNASELISAIVDAHAEDFFSSDEYIGYIAHRPGVEKTQQSHGLFSSYDDVDLEAVKKEVSETPGNLYTAVLSLRREDAARLSFDNATAWKNLIRKNIAKIAAAYKIPLTDIRWYAAFHNESHHPHCHMLVHSVGRKPYINTDGIESIKSELATDIFRDEFYSIYQRQNESIEEVTAEVKKILANGDTAPVAAKLTKLAQKLSGYHGRKVYGYLPADCKALADSILSELAQNPYVTVAYDQYLDARREQLLVYHSEKTLPPAQPITENKKFQKVKNVIVHEAFLLRDRLSEISAAAELPDPILMTYDDELPEPEYNGEDQQDAEDFEQFDETEIPENFAAAELPIPGSAETADRESHGAACDELFKQLSQKILSEDYNVKVRYGKKHYAENRNYYKSKKELYAAEAPEAEKAALEKLMRHALSGHAYALYDIASFASSGKFLPQNAEFANCAYKLTLDCFIKSLTDIKNTEYLMYRIGKMYYYGLGTDKDPVQAVEYIKPAADSGNRFASFTMGTLYEHGEGVKQSLTDAVHYYERAASVGHPYAAYKLAVMYEYGNDVISQSQTEAERYYRLAYAGFQRQLQQSPDDYLYIKLGTMALQGKGCEVDYNLAEEYLHKAYELNCPGAAYKLGQLYSNIEFDNHSTAKAVEYFKASYEKEQNAYAAYKLGRIYYFGADDFDSDRKLGKEYLSLAAAAGISAAAEIKDNYQAVLAGSIISLFRSAVQSFTSGAGVVAKSKHNNDIKERLKRGERISHDTTIINQ